MRQEIPKLPNKMLRPIVLLSHLRGSLAFSLLPDKKLPPVLLWTCSPLRDSLALLLSPQSGLMGKKYSKRGELGSAAFCLWEEAVCLHKSPCLGEGIGLVKAPTGNPRTGSLLCSQGPDLVFLPRNPWTRASGSSLCSSTNHRWSS